MRLLLAITTASSCAVLGVGLALARGIRRRRDIKGAPVTPHATHHATREFFEAGEFRTPRPLTLNQEIHQQRPRRALSEITFAERQTPASSAPAPNNPLVLRPEIAKVTSLTPGTPFNQKTNRVTRIDSHLRSVFTPPRELAGDISSFNTAPPSAPVEFTGNRIPPQSVKAPGLRRRVDLSQYNRGSGGRTDPSYNHPLRGSGTQGPAPADRRGR